MYPHIKDSLVKFRVWDTVEIEEMDFFIKKYNYFIFSTQNFVYSMMKIILQIALGLELLPCQNSLTSI